jgi:phage/plasmid primase-like uncharacterized protein
MTKKIKKIIKKSRPATAKNVSEVKLLKDGARSEQKLNADEVKTIVETISTLNHTSSQMSQLVYEDINKQWDRGLAKHIVLNLHLCNSTIQRILGVKSGLFKE